MSPSPLPVSNFRSLRNIEDGPFLFEIAWEVCNQLGGIYTVLKTKAPAMINRWGDNYCAVGPYNNESASVEFERRPPPRFFSELISKLEKIRIKAHYGVWLIPGTPQVLLIDFSERMSQVGDEKYLLWKDNHLGMEESDSEVDATISFGFAVYELLRIATELAPKRKFLAHVHEWMAGVVLPRIAHLRLPIATIFTTHATLLGRYIASGNQNFYEQLDWIDPEHSAAQYGIKARFRIERAASHSATIFSTISEITNREATKFLGRSADQILPNGLNAHRFTALHEFQNLHLQFKERIHEFVMGHFFPSYTFDLDRTIYLFTSGRYEYRNKGMDIFIESLHRLNQRLKETPDPPTVVSFIVTKGWTKNVNIQAIQNHVRLEDLNRICEEVTKQVRSRMLRVVASGKTPRYEDLVDEDLSSRLKRATLQFRNRGLPAVVTHDMGNDRDDPILNHLRHRRLFNDPSDPVKIIYHPDFITNSSPLFNLDYSEFVRGCHMGVFPSYYEPWGYTPPECLALGIPAVTTDLSGFGSFVTKHIDNPHYHGVHILDRSSQSSDASIEDLTNHLLRFLELSRRERIELRNRSEQLTEQFDWNVLISYYHSAHDKALLSKFNLPI